MRRGKRMMEELDEDIREHIARETQENVERGMSPEDARTAAMRKFGNVARVKEETRSVWRFVWVEELLRDMRFAMRMLRKAPGFTTVAVLTLALGIGANTAMFSVLYGLVLRPLPYKNASRLVMLWDSNRKSGQEHIPGMDGSYPILRSQAKSFENIAGLYRAIPRNQLFAERIWGTEERVAEASATSQLFSILGVASILGRPFIPSDDVATVQGDSWEGSNVAILSYAFWRQHYGASADVIGKTISLNRFGIQHQYTIVGVMPRGFDFPYPLDPSKPDLWTDLPIATAAVSPSNDLLVLGCLRPGVSVPEAQAEVNTIADRIRVQYPKYYKDEDINVVPLKRDLIHDTGSILWVMLAAFGFILLIGCANVGNLLLVRAVAREKEMGIRVTLGASRLALIRQMLIEGMLLAFVGGALGMLLAYGSLCALVALLPQSLYIPRLDSLALDTRMLAFAALLSVLAAGIFSVLPSLRLTRPNLNETLKSGSARKTLPANSVLRRPGSVLLVVEVSLALVLLTGALLMLRSMQKLLAVNSQFQPERLLSMNVIIDGAYWRSLSGDREPARIRFEQFEQRIAAMPGVEEVALTLGAPLIVHQSVSDEIEADGGGGPIAKAFQAAEMRLVTPEYLDIMDIGVLRGRWLMDDDTSGTLPVAVINEAMAERYWPNRDPLGLKVQPQYRYTQEKIWYTIVGIVHEPKRFATGDTPQPTVYLSYWQNVVASATAIVRTAANPKGIAAAMHAAALQLVPGHVLVGQVQTGDDMISESSAMPRFTSQLLTAFSGLALLLALVGIYGLISYYTSRRTHEIGIRMALGAQRKDVMRLVLREGMLIVGLGVAIGVVAAGAFARTLESLLYGVAATDIDSFAASAMVLVVVAVAACWMPARRATKVDPMEALRYE